MQDLDTARERGRAGRQARGSRTGSRAGAPRAGEKVPAATDRQAGGLELVVSSLEPWDDIWRRNQYLLAGLLRHDPRLRVLFVEPPSDPLHAALSRHRPRKGAGLRPLTGISGVADGRAWAYQPTKVLPRVIGGSVEARQATSVIRAVRRVGFVRPVLWINNPSSAALLVLTGWPAMYDVTDDWLSTHRGSAEHARLAADEHVLMERCFAVTVCSPALAESKGKVRPVHLIPNAVDVERYTAPYPRPRELPPGRTAVYAGTVHTDRVDIGLCVSVARMLRRRKLGTVVLVGPAPLPLADRHRLEDAGVLLLGAKPYYEVPAYLQHADVLLAPEVVNEFTESLDPIKQYEYRAVRKPIVATPVSGFREHAGGLVTVCEASTFPAAVAGLLAASEGADPPTLVDTAHPASDGIPTWQERAEELAEILAQAVR